MHDEEQIRELVSTWMSATKRGDLDALLALMADDIVFLVAGQAPMDKAGYAKLQKAQWAQGVPEFDGTSDIQEIEVRGDRAFMWTKLSISVKPREGGRPITRAGYTLSILRKERGKWVLARDANLLAPAPPGGQ